MNDLRVGYGFDVHRMAEGRNCVLGGISIPHTKGPDGHSDADVLIHAICDALLGAANLRDIGFHFPDTDSSLKNADSSELLKSVVQLLNTNGYKILNVDSTVVAERPKLSTYIQQMQEKLSSCMSIETSRISIKATTNEKLGYIGQEEGIEAHAVALIAR